MKNIDELNEEELQFLANNMPLKTARDYCKKFPNAFQKISYKDARKLNHTDIIPIFTQKRGNKFVRDFIDLAIKSVLLPAKEEFDNQKENGADDYDAFAHAICTAKLSDNISFFFKLSEDPINEDDFRIISDRVHLLVAAETKKSVDEVKSNPLENYEFASTEEKDHKEKLEINNTVEEALKAEIAHLKSELDISSARVEAAEHKVDDVTQTLDTQKQQISELFNKNASLNAELSNAIIELDQYRKLAAYIEDDSQEDNSSEMSYEYRSVCQILPVPDSNGFILMSRLADISNDKIIRFFVNEDLPKTYANRDRMYWHDGPSEAGFIGVWDWQPEPSEKDREKDRAKTYFNKSVIPTQVVIVNECKTIENLIKHLQGGITHKIVSTRILFAFYDENKRITGVLCNKENLRETGAGYALNDSVFNLPQYSFSNNDIVWLANLAFLRIIKLGLPVDEVQVKNASAIIKNIVLQRITWSVFKEKGINKAEWKNFRTYLESLPEASLIEDICKSCRCTASQATELFSEFKKNACKFIDGSTIEDSLIVSAIQDNDDLMERSKKLVAGEWKAENATLIYEEEAKIKALQAEIEKRESVKEALSSEISEKETMLRDIENTIADKSKIADDVESIVASRIEKAKDYAAEFVATMSFISPTQRTESEHAQLVSHFESGKPSKYDELEEYSNAKEAVECIRDELFEAGVSEQATDGLAAYLFSCFINKTNLMLIGPNGQDIADAFSIAMFGEESGRLFCDGEFSYSTVNDCFNSKSKVVSIVNPFNPNWITRLPEVAGNSNQFFICVYPYSEDIQIEPKSLFTYFLPMLTELFVSGNSRREFMGSLKADNCKPFDSKEASPVYHKTLSALHAGQFMKSKIQAVITNADSLTDSGKEDNAIIYALLPYAYATMQTSAIIDEIQTKKELHISEETIRKIQTILGDFE